MNSLKAQPSCIYAKLLPWHDMYEYVFKALFASPLRCFGQNVRLKCDGMLIGVLMRLLNTDQRDYPNLPHIHSWEALQTEITDWP